jgi:hypothetical protein
VVLLLLVNAIEYAGMKGARIVLGGFQLRRKREETAAMSGHYVNAGTGGASR